MKRILYLKGEEVQGLIYDEDKEITTIFIKGGTKCVITMDWLREDKINDFISKVANNEVISLVYDDSEGVSLVAMQASDLLEKISKKLEEDITPATKLSNTIKPKTFY